MPGALPEPRRQLTVTYEVDGEERALTLTPDQITCDADSVHGLAVSNDPQGRFSIRLDGDHRGSVGAGSDEGLVLFEAAELDLSGSDAVLTIGESKGEVSVVEGWEPGDDVNVSADDAGIPRRCRDRSPVKVPSPCRLPNPEGCGRLHPSTRAWGPHPATPHTPQHSLGPISLSKAQISVRIRLRLW